jgi:transposase
MEGENLQELIRKQAKIISEQAKLIDSQAEIIRKLEARITELAATIARLQKDSHNSSKPPSSDIVKPKSAEQKRNGDKKQKIGGQKGHKKHERTPFPPEQVDRFIERILDICPECGGVLNECGEIVSKQQIEIVEKPIIVTEYHCHTYICPACQTVHMALVPEEMRSGLFSVGLIAVAAYLKGRCHVSFSALKAFFQEVLGIAVSGGFLVKQIKKAGGALRRVHEELVERLKGERHLHIDESGWKEKGKKRWIWAFRAGKYAVFIIRDSRGEGVLEEVLGKGYRGIISCDFYGAYRKFGRVSGALLQFCWAHLIREVLFLTGLKEASVVRYGKRILKQIRGMFETIHHKEEMDGEEWERRLREQQGKIMRRATGTVPEQKEAGLIARRLKEREEDYFRFIGAEIEATNNAAEVTIRQCVLDRVVTQGSRGKAGNEWHERFWSVFTTCGIQNISVINYLRACLSAYIGGGTFPNLINPA